jgi:hypothetical protein
MRNVLPIFGIMMEIDEGEGVDVALLMKNVRCRSDWEVMFAG